MCYENIHIFSDFTFSSLTTPFNHSSLFQWPPPSFLSPLSIYLVVGEVEEGVGVSVLEPDQDLGVWVSLVGRQGLCLAFPDTPGLRGVREELEKEMILSSSSVFFHCLLVFV